MKLKSTLILLFMGSMFFANAQTNVPALITSNTTWTSAGNPYKVNQNCFLDSGIVLTIEAGVVIEATAKNLKMSVQGTVNAKGTASSHIKVDDLSFEFKENAVDYRPTTLKGNAFRYVDFKGYGTTTSKALGTRSTDILAKNCTFKDCFYAVSISSNSLDSVTVCIDSCTFLDSASRTYPINASGNTSVLKMTNSSIYGASGVNFYGDVYIENCVFENIKYYFNVYGNGVITCNQFSNIRDGLTFRPPNSSSAPNMEFTYNTLDSSGWSLNSPMILYQNILAKTNMSDVNFNYNNFLSTNTPTGEKIVVYGGNKNPLTFDKLDFTSNYWGTTDTTHIDTMIKDYNDDINIYAKADYANYRSSKVTTCRKSKCKASYYLAIDTANKYNLFIINNSTGTNSNTKYIWTFGDGKGSTKSNPTHQYSSFGLYELCLTIYDSSNYCYSTFCDSIGLDSNGKLLKADGFTITVLDEDDLVGIEEVKTINYLNLYPNPSNGLLNIDFMGSLNSDLSIQIMNYRGQVIKNINKTQKWGENHIQVSMEEFENGLYFISLKNQNQSITKKVILHK